jgi:hypothetical protein
MVEYDWIEDKEKHDCEGLDWWVLGLKLVKVIWLMDKV